MKTVAVLHTTPVTIQGLAPQFARELPGVRQTNFLDDTMLPEINAAGEITPAVRCRFYALAAAAAASRPDAILCACSSVGGLLEEARGIVSVPALRIDDPRGLSPDANLASAREAVARGTRIAVSATLASTLGPTMDLIRRRAEEAGKEISLTPFLVEGAGALLAQGRMEEYRQAVAGRISEALQGSDVVVLAQASMADAAALLPDAASLPILTSPRSGVAALRSVLGLEEPAK